MTTNFTRLSSANTYDSAMRNLSERQSKLASLQESLTSGKKIVHASDDPTGAALAERAMTRIARIQTDQRALDSQRNSIVSAESTLGDVVDALQNFRELVVTAGNGIHTASERKAIATQMSGLRDQIFSLANRKDSNGLPLFSALGSALTPFVGPQSVAPDYTFNGLPGQAASSDVSIPFALDGDSAFMHQPAHDGVFNVTIPVGVNPNLSSSGVTITNSALVTGAPYSVVITSVGPGATAGTTSVSYSVTDNSGPTLLGVQTAPDFPSAQAANIAVVGIPGLSMNIKGTLSVGDTFTLKPSPSVFSVLDDAIRDIGSAPSGNAAAQAVTQALGNIDVGLSRVSSVRGQAGDLLNRADRISTNQEKRSIQLEGDRSRAEDLDMTKGISEFQNQQTGYQAALQSYAQIQKISLFNYLT